MKDKNKNGQYKVRIPAFDIHHKIQATETALKESQQDDMKVVDTLKTQKS